MPLPSLPVDAHLGAIRTTLEEAGRLVLVAPPGSGKSTRVPPALLEGNSRRLLLLQPRRVAARTLARRIAVESGATLGEEVGWQIRLERRFGPRTRLLVATEGILTARLREDPFLSDFDLVVLDEFHERSLQTDLCLAFLAEARQAREDLRVVVMSATLEADAVAAYLSRGEATPCPVLEVPGRVHPLTTHYHPDLSPARAVRLALEEGEGDVLVFLPGKRDIERTGEELRRGPPLPARVLPLHGSLPPEEQERALAPCPERKVILATNVAETSLTVPGVRAVVDSGRHKQLRFSPRVQLDRLEVERISRASATQRAGRAGRLGPGRVYRLWDPRDHLEPHREPEIRRVDSAAPLLEVLAWGADPRDFSWFEAPPGPLLEQGLETLRTLGALVPEPPGSPGVESPLRLNPLGQELARLPLPPRLGRLLLACGRSREGAELVALLAEGRGPTGDSREAPGREKGCDAQDLLGSFPRTPRKLQQLARRLRSRGGGHSSPEELGRALVQAFPDRVARRRSPGDPRLLLASGHGAELSRESRVHQAEWMVALELRARPGQEALVYRAAALEPEWLEPTSEEVEHHLDPRAGAVRARRVRRYRSLVLGEETVPADPARSAPLLAAAMAADPGRWIDEAQANRLAFAGLSPDPEPWFQAACLGRTRWPDFRLLDHLDHRQRQVLEREAPETWRLPSGREVRLEYRSDGRVLVAAKLQEFFGLGETPRIGSRGTPLLCSLLSPAGRPVQLTDDLGNFWRSTYPEVRKQLRGRYPRHPWPEDPWSAEPTRRTRPRKSR